MTTYRGLLVCALALPGAGCASRDVEVYVTTGDRGKLLDRDANLRLERMAQGAAVIDVDESKSYQAIVGFGAALTDASAFLIQHVLTAPARDALLRDLFGNAGLSFVRVDMGASDFSLRHYSYDDVTAGRTDSSLAHFSIAADTDATIPILERALEINPRLTIMASPWSAPAWMKTSGSMIGGTLRPSAYDAYAEYFRRFIEAYAARGISIYAVTVQNEPHYEPGDYPGMRLEPAARARFIAKHLGPLLERTAIRSRILEWDHNWDEPASPLAVLSDPMARRYVAGVAWHCYAGEVTAQAIVHDRYPDKDVFFTECSGGEWAPRFADNLIWMVRTLIIGSTRQWARGVLLWNLALDEHHGPHTGGCGDCRGVVTIDSKTARVTRNEEYYALAHASRFVRPGARRIASSIVDSLDNVAFRNEDGSRVLIVVNSGGTAKRLEVREARTGAGGFKYTMPAASVATFRWR